MTAVRAWRRQLYGGLGAVLVVPLTLLAALALLAFAGGFARLGALGQAFSGPSLPAIPSLASKSARPHSVSAHAVKAVLPAPDALAGAHAVGAPGWGEVDTRSHSRVRRRGGSSKAERRNRYGGGAGPVPSGGSSSNPSAGGSTPAKLLPSGGSAPESGATTGGASLGDVSRPAKPSGRIVDTVSAVGTKHPTSVAPVATAAAP